MAIHRTARLALSKAVAENNEVRDYVFGVLGVSVAKILKNVSSTWQDLGNAEGQVDDVFLVAETIDGKNISLHGKVIGNFSKLSEKQAEMFCQRAKKAKLEGGMEHSLTVVFAPGDWMFEPSSAAQYFIAKIAFEDLIHWDPALAGPLG